MLLNWGNLLIAGVTERQPDIFQPIGLTLGKTSGVSPSELVRHRQHFADSIRVPVQSLTFQKQVHGARIQVIRQDARFAESDGMITNTRGVVLCVLVADCCGVLVYDKENQSIGAFHSGWRGTHENIVGRGIEAMQKRFGTDPASALVYLSPCASGERYIVRRDVADLFPTAVVQVADDQYLFDNRKRIAEQLADSGVERRNMSISNDCTLTDIRFHSFRRDGEKSGRTAVFIGLK
jgi:YfiH family protein